MIKESLVRNCLVLLDKEFYVTEKINNKEIESLRNNLINNHEYFRECMDILRKFVSLTDDEIDYIYATFVLNIGIDYKNEKLKLPKLKTFNAEKVYYTSNTVVESFNYETYLPSMMGLFIYDDLLEYESYEIVDEEIVDFDSLKLYDENNNFITEL